VSVSKPPTLRCRGITKRFGALVANDHIDFDVRAGEIHALVGENGAGKTTLMSVLYGLLAPDEGVIELDGEAVRFASCAEAMRAGIGMVFQHYLLVERFSVAENVLLGREPAMRGFIDKDAALSAVHELAARYRFSIDPSASVETLGVGARQQVELLRVLGRNPRTIILDEPTAALSPTEMTGLFEVMDRLRSDGRAVIFITHKLKEVMRLCDRITVLRRARVVGTIDHAGASEELLGSMMIGGQLEPLEPPSVSTTQAHVVLDVRGLTVARDDGSVAVSSIDLVCRAGEITGIAGVEGNGQLEFAEALYGIRPMTSGSISLGGQNLEHMTLSDRRRAGMRYISPDRQREGLVLDFNAIENALLGDVRSSQHGVLLDLALGSQRGADIAHRFHIETYEAVAPMRRYSGGTQQKFLVGRETSGSPLVIIAFAPTRGVDIGAAQSIYERLRETQDAGACILLISYDLDEIRALADRILVFHAGAVAGELLPHNADDATLGRLMGSGAS
jgi:general nucleoside transport system ATP-binding protein